MWCVDLRGKIEDFKNFKGRDKSRDIVGTNAVKNSLENVIYGKNYNMIRHVKHKFGAIATKKDGINFPSRLEARYYEHLLLMKKSGELLEFLRQPLFDLPGKVTYRADFIEFWKDGTVRVVDVKGMPPTEAFRIKQRMVEELYPHFKIEVVNKI